MKSWHGVGIRLVAALVAAPLAFLSACGEAQPEDPDSAAPSQAANCIADEMDGALTQNEVDGLEFALQLHGFGRDDAHIADLGFLANLNLSRGIAVGVLNAADRCVIDINAIVTAQAEAHLTTDTAEASACVAEAATDENIREYAEAVAVGLSASTSGSGYVLWRELTRCDAAAALNDPSRDLPDTSSPTQTPTNNGYFDKDDDSTGTSSGADSSSGSDEPIERCLEFAMDEQALILDMLYAGEITELQYEQMMAESGSECFDLR